VGKGDKKMKKNEASTHSHGGNKRNPKPTKYFGMGIKWKTRLQIGFPWKEG
jgi:hypothetical protein